MKITQENGRLFLGDFNSSNENEETKKGFYKYPKIIAAFLKCFGLIESLESDEGKIRHVSKGKLNKWLESHGNTETQIPFTDRIEKVIGDFQKNKVEKQISNLFPILQENDFPLQKGYLVIVKAPQENEIEKKEIVELPKSLTNKQEFFEWLKKNETLNPSSDLAELSKVKAYLFVEKDNGDQHVWSPNYGHVVEAKGDLFSTTLKNIGFKDEEIQALNIK